MCLLGIVGAEAAREGFRTLMQRAAVGSTTGARIEGVLVAKQLEGGVECIMGIQRDPVFGPVARRRDRRHLRRDLAGRGAASLPVRARGGRADDPQLAGGADPAGRAR